MAVNIGRTVETVDVDILVVVTFELELVDNAVSLHSEWLVARQLSTEVDVCGKNAELFVSEHRL